MLSYSTPGVGIIEIFLLLIIRGAGIISSWSNNFTHHCSWLVIFFTIKLHVFQIAVGKRVLILWLFPILWSQETALPMRSTFRQPSVRVIVANCHDEQPSTKSWIRFICLGWWWWRQQLSIQMSVGPLSGSCSQIQNQRSQVALVQLC